MTLPSPGREVCLAWRLSEGALPYRDVAHFNGPLPDQPRERYLVRLGGLQTRFASLALARLPTQSERLSRARPTDETPVRTQHGFLPALALALTLPFASCKGATEVCNASDPLCNPSAPAPTTVTLSPPAFTLAVGETQQLTPSVLDQDGQPISGASITWSSNNMAVASVSAAGLVMAEGLGSTSIKARAGTVEGSASVTVGDPCEPIGKLLLGDFDVGTLSTSDCPIGGDQYVDFWALDVSASDAGRIQVDLISSDFDTYLALIDIGGNPVAENDDAHLTGDQAYDYSSHVDEDLTVGTYTIVVAGVDVGELGDYTLYVGPGLDCVEQGSIAVGSSTSGASLATSDCTYANFYADAYVVHVTSDALVTFDMTSVDVDAYLTLYDPAGNFLDDDDDTLGGVSGLDAQITIQLTAGWYVIEASSASDGETGTYTLSVH